MKDKVVVISGGSRGIGAAIALKLAHRGATIAILAKSTTEDPRLGGTIFSVATAIENAGGKAIPIACDIRDTEQIENAINTIKQSVDSIDYLIHNASAISLTNTAQTSIKSFDLMHAINVRGTYMLTQYCLPLIKTNSNSQILTLSPPISFKDEFLAPHIAYTMAKYNMTMMALAWAAEFKAMGIASNALWPATTIATAAVNNLLGGPQLMQKSRTPEIVADAVAIMFNSATHTYNGAMLLDETVLTDHGITDFSKYAVNHSESLQRDLFL